MHKSRTYHDPLHGAITLRGDDPVERLLIKIIDQKIGSKAPPFTAALC